MPLEAQLAHRVIKNMALPYRTNVSPIDTDPYLAKGSTDILTSFNQYAERRPGFALNLETTPTVFNNLQRVFPWERTDGTFIYMANDINASNKSVVYKLVVGSDNSFVSLFTDATSGNPFDFVISNNQVYFSNGNTVKKWDPQNGLSNWGISIGSVNNAVGPNFPATGADVSNAFGSGITWANPSNITAEDGVYSTATLGAGNQITDFLQASSFTFTIPGTNTVTGVLVEVKGYNSGTWATGQFFVNLMLNSAIVGSQKGIQALSFPVSNTWMSLGGTGDLWGLTQLSPSDVNATGFGVSMYVNQGVGNAIINIDAVRVTIYGLGGPTVALTTGSLSPATGFQYVFCYGNSRTGHISSPTPLSTLIKPAAQGVQVSLTASTDTQVNQIRLFRTTDGGAGSLFEIPTSPYANTTANVTDNAADSALNVNSIAPTPNFNDPPTPMVSLAYFSGRIWGINGNKVYFTGLEEIIQGVPEECMPSGVGGNFWNFDQAPASLSLVGQGENQALAILSPGRLYAITGNTLDTFQRYRISKRRGCRNRKAVAELGGMTAWLDTSTQVWASNGSTIKEVSQDIRSDLSGVTQANCSMTFHVAGRFHWMVLSTGTKLYVYDMDTEQWMPPWTFACQNIISAETSAGNYELIACTATKAVKLSPTTFNDQGSTYAPVIRTGLISLVPDFGRRFSYMAMGLYDEPSRTGVPWIFQVTNNGKALSDVLILADDDPTAASSVYQSIFTNKQDPSVTYNRSQGTALTQQVFPTTQPAARWVSMQINLASADQADNVYETFLAYKPEGGR